MILKIVATLYDSIDILVPIGNNQLERTEEFFTTNFKILDKLFKRNLNGCRLICPIASGDMMFC